MYSLRGGEWSCPCGIEISISRGWNWFLMRSHLQDQYKSDEGKIHKTFQVQCFSFTAAHWVTPLHLTLITPSLLTPPLNPTNSSCPISPAKSLHPLQEQEEICFWGLDSQLQKGQAQQPNCPKQRTQKEIQPNCHFFHLNFGLAFVLELGGVFFFSHGLGDLGLFLRSGVWKRLRIISQVWPCELRKERMWEFS